MVLVRNRTPAGLERLLEEALSDQVTVLASVLCVLADSRIRTWKTGAAMLSVRAAMRDRGAKRGFKGLVRRAEEGQRGVAIIPPRCNALVSSVPPLAHRLPSPRSRRVRRNRPHGAAS